MPAKVRPKHITHNSGSAWTNSDEYAFIDVLGTPFQTRFNEMAHFDRLLLLRQYERASWQRKAWGQMKAEGIRRYVRAAIREAEGTL